MPLESPRRPAALRRSAAAACVVLLALVAGCPTAPPLPPPPQHSDFRFAVIGDVPYGAAEVPKMDALIAQLNADPGLAFVIHVGDIKGGSEPCSDDFLRQRLQQIQTLRAPVVFTPGDNDWTDCHRTSAGQHLPTERLAFLRRLFFADPTRSIGRPGLALAPQSAVPGFEPFVENAIWLHRRVLFATVHVVGSSNGLEPWRGMDPSDSEARPRADRMDEFRSREAAALAWIDTAFDRASAADAAAVVIAWQANPLFERAAGDSERAGFEAVLARLKARALAFQRPVLLLHGDFHDLIVDRPLTRAAEPAPKVPWLLRVQTYGSPRVQGVKLHVDASAPAVFAVEPLPVPGH